MSSPFSHYHACFDPEELIRRYAATDLKPTPGYFTNFLGVKIDPKFVPEILAGREGQLDHLPIPANWHSDVAEWGAALRAVDLAAGPEFVLVELGCGWGCWMNNAGLAAKKRKLQVRLIGVEGDEGHCRFANESMKCNGFNEREFEVWRGIAASRAGTALFPRQAQPGHSWGLEPIFGASDEQIAAAIASNSCDVLPIVSLAEVFSKHEKIDLLHVDIQGGELELAEQSIAVLGEKVIYLLIGTHSREIEGGLFEVLLRHGWELEIERPAILKIQAGRRPTVVVDGVQGWRNKRLDRKFNTPVIVDGASFDVPKNGPAISSYFLGSGWSHVEAEHVWSDGKEAELALRLDSSRQRRLYLDLHAFLPHPTSTQQIEVTANGLSVGKVAFTHSSNRKKCFFDLPGDLGPSILLRILVEKPVSPRAVGLSKDSRELGVALLGLGSADQATPVTQRPAAQAPGIAVGKFYTVTANSSDFSNFFLGAGWSQVERDFVWSEGKEAELTLRFESMERKRLCLEMRAFLPTAKSAQRVTVKANGVSLGAIDFDRSADRGKYYFDLPENFGASIRLEILVANPVSPKEAGISGDSRKLGIALSGFGLVDPVRGGSGDEPRPDPATILGTASGTANPSRRPVEP